MVFEKNTCDALTWGVRWTLVGPWPFPAMATMMDLVGQIKQAANNPQGTILNKVITALKNPQKLVAPSAAAASGTEHITDPAVLSSEAKKAEAKKAVKGEPPSPPSKPKRQRT